MAAFFSSADGEGEFVVAGCKGSPLLEDVEAAFDDVAAFVVIFVEGGSLPPREPRCFRCQGPTAELGLPTVEER